MVQYIYIYIYSLGLIFAIWRPWTDLTPPEFRLLTKKVIRRKIPSMSRQKSHVGRSSKQNIPHDDEKHLEYWK